MIKEIGIDWYLIDGELLPPNHPYISYLNNVSTTKTIVTNSFKFKKSRDKNMHLIWVLHTKYINLQISINKDNLYELSWINNDSIINKKWFFNRKLADKYAYWWLTFFFNREIQVDKCEIYHLRSYWFGQKTPNQHIYTPNLYDGEIHDVEEE